MFDSSRSFESFEPFLNSEQAAAQVRVHPKTLQRLARNGRVIGYRVGKLWRFRASDLDGWSQDSEQIAIDSQAEQSYSVLNHSCPQPNRR
ncbi:MAG: helix-turn-helix domain-containing protein, partial [Acidimicrobiales bacterium]